MSENVILFLIGQSVVIVGSIVVAYVKTAVAIAELKIHTQATQIQTQGLSKDHGNLARQVNGISRSLARLEGAAHLTPVVPDTAQK